ncbi:MAG: peroxiredoxin [Nitrosospira sp.]|nr:peroxiredoxin [Nitrosospira sp.]MBI0407182.1 peroxiredoxin [Nitrosospira sp.]MBI0414595.1 peroxiredoxin [Nitrosospira sp.]MBI0417281.1 peroxiredoxin [Nitrosospira sp.]MBI0419573.1 peroxiredoxin [Nitrosospira sp.]
MLQVGESAPNFYLPDADMKMVSLSSFKNKKNIVLYFYPKDDTPGCTAQALALSDLEDHFAKFNTVILGVSRDDCISHGSFRDKHGITIRLLSDNDNETCKKYDVLQKKEINGEIKICFTRSTFIIDKQSVLRHIFYGVSVQNHATRILEAIKNI